MTDSESVERFVAIVGARMWGPYPRQGRWKSIWKARATGEDRLVDLYTRIEPFLGVRRRARFQEVLLGFDAEERISSWKPRRWEWIAWAAGLFEAEGCISTTDSTPRLIVVSVDEDVLQTFSSVLGGTIKGPYRRSGSSTGAPRQPYFHWDVCGLARCSLIGTHLRPWLGTRRREKLSELVTGLRYVQGLNQALYLQEELWEQRSSESMRAGARNSKSPGHGAFLDATATD